MPVSLSRNALKDLRRIGPGPDLDRIDKALAKIAESASREQFPSSTKPLVGTSGSILRTRQGDYRILWTVTDSEVLVVRIVHRKDLDQVAATL